MRNITRISAVLLVVALFIAPTQSYAWRGHDRDHGRDHYGRHREIGFRTSFLPRGFFTVVIGGGRYYYYDGVYYSGPQGEFYSEFPRAVQLKAVCVK